MATVGTPPPLQPWRHPGLALSTWTGILRASESKSSLSLSLREQHWVATPWSAVFSDVMVVEAETATVVVARERSRTVWHDRLVDPVGVVE